MVSYVARLAKFALVEHANVGRLHLVLGGLLEHIAMLQTMFVNVHDHLPHVNRALMAYVLVSIQF